MGTRSLTHFIDEPYEKNGKEVRTKIVTMYRQFDGYPTGHGLQLAKFLNSGVMVNGISLGEQKTLLFNGMGCLAAQAVAHFKKEAGGFYLYRGGTKDCGEEYSYDVISNGEKKELTLVCREEGYTRRTKIIFKGTPAEFIAKYDPPKPEPKSIVLDTDGKEV